LLGDQGEQLAFAHEMYQEYFAACGLKWRYEADPRVVEPLQGQPHWREPLVLLLGLFASAESGQALFQQLFERIVRDEPAVAATYVVSTVRPRVGETEQLRQRLRDMDYERASDEELRKVLEAIYILGDGALLAQHLQERQRYNRLKGIGRQIAEAFTGEEPALRATLDALKQLGRLDYELCHWILGPMVAFREPQYKRRNSSPELVLLPLRAKELRIPGELQREAYYLWRTWRTEYNFSPPYLGLLALAFHLDSKIADEIREFTEKLLAERDWDEASCWIETFRLQSHFKTRIFEILPDSELEKLAPKLAPMIRKSNDHRQAIFSALSKSAKPHIVLRNRIALYLLRRYGDVANTAELLAPLGFCREHIEHNRGQLERVERMEQALAETGALPEGENLEDLELFGYVHESGCILAPGFRDFRISWSAKWQDHARQVVRFRLVVERHPADNSPVLNATNLVPV
jgi:hypothetical protein